MRKKSQFFPKPCPECGGQRVRTTFEVVPIIGMERNELQIGQPERVIGLGGLFTGRSNKSGVASVSCTNCGYTALYATEPGNLMPDGE